MTQFDVLAAPMSQSLKVVLADRAAVIERAIDRLLPRLDRPEGRLVDAMRYASLGGGKRLRGFLVMEVASLLGADEPASVDVAASVEMLHAYSLIHDDLPSMDDDDMRRGQPSTHRAFGEATAILAGDALQARSFEILAAIDDLDADAKCELLLTLSRAVGMEGMVGGQMIDMQSEGCILSLADIMQLQALKTGRLIQYSAEAGAIVASAKQPTRHLMAEYGRAVGAAFQIADDVLDAVGAAETLGKTAGKDAVAGKATVVAAFGITGAREHARALAEHAAEQLRDFGPEADLLRALTVYVVERRS